MTCRSGNRTWWPKIARCSRPMTGCRCRPFPLGSNGASWSALPRRSIATSNGRICWRPSEDGGIPDVSAVRGARGPAGGLVCLRTPCLQADHGRLAGHPRHSVHTRRRSFRAMSIARCTPAMALIQGHTCRGSLSHPPPSLTLPGGRPHVPRRRRCRVEVEAGAETRARAYPAETGRF